MKIEHGPSLKKISILRGLKSEKLSIFLWNRRLANQVLTAEQIFPSLGLDSHFLQLALHQVVHPSTPRHFQNPKNFKILESITTIEYQFSSQNKLKQLDFLNIYCNFHWNYKISYISLTRGHKKKVDFN